MARIRTAEEKQDDHLVSRYGITLADKQHLFDAQDRRCAICGRTDAPRWVLDHDHAVEDVTGEIRVRGVLCANCNSMLGMAHDSEETLASAIKYLNQHSKRKSQ